MLPPFLFDTNDRVWMISVPLDNAIGFHDPLTITWYYDPTADGPWHEAGTSANPVSVLLGAPLYQTLVHLGCENAAGDNCASVLE